MEEVTDDNNAMISKLSLVIFMCDRNDEILLDDDQLVENKNLF